MVASPVITGNQQSSTDINYRSVDTVNLDRLVHEINKSIGPTWYRKWEHILRARKLQTNLKDDRILILATKAPFDLIVLSTTQRSQKLLNLSALKPKSVLCSSYSTHGT